MQDEAQGKSLSACGIFHFRFHLVFIKVYIFVPKKLWTLSLKRQNSFQNKRKRKATHSFDPRPLIFKLQQEVWKFTDTCVRTQFFLDSKF